MYDNLRHLLTREHNLLLCHIKLLKDAGTNTFLNLANNLNRLLHLLDDRFAGIAMGVGTSRILGRIHSTKMQIKETFFQCSITILEDDKVEFLFGLDMLKRHQV